jgi:hypothetical protein
MEQSQIIRESAELEYYCRFQVDTKSFQQQLDASCNDPSTIQVVAADAR